MKNPVGTALWACLWLFASFSASSQQVIINEIMYHPPSHHPRDEWVELFNAGPTNVNLTGWHITGGIDFAFASNTVIEAGSYLVVVASAAAFDENYPTVGNVAGSWLNFTVTNVNGRAFTNWFPELSNTRNSINLKNASGIEVNSVTYADDGDWAVRQRSPSLSGQRGWIWTAEHDGLGKSLELVNSAVRNDCGQNWRPSITVNGTPGAPNSVRSGNIAPLIMEAQHLPLVPRSTEPVRITARIVNETAAGVTATLFFRTNSASPPPFLGTAMFDDGAHGDGVAGDGIYGVILPAMPNNTLIEWYVQASDAQAITRTWPAPAIDAADLGGGNLGQAANALFQVDDSTYSSAAPLYKLILTQSEWGYLGILFSNAPNSDAQVNATFLSVDGNATECRYLAGVRNRGHGSRNGNPHNYRINLPGAAPWKGVSALNMNARTVPAQVVGATVAQKAGAAGNNSHFAQLRVNNAGGPGGTPPNSLYAANEDADRDWASRSFPDNDGGNIYSVVRDIRPPNFNYRGEDPVSYQNTYFKDSNVSENDWRDLMGMLEVMGENQTATFTMARARAVIDVEQWLVHLAVMSLFGNSESGINTGNNDDYALYRGLNDPRFVLVYHDLDSVLGLGSLGANSGIFGATICCASGDTDGIANAMNFFMHHPEVEPLYYRTLQDLLDGPFSSSQFNATVDLVFANFPELASSATTVKNYMNSRRATVQALINGLVPPSTRVFATVSGEPRSPTLFSSATLAVSGNGITHYRYKLNNGAYGLETPVATPIVVGGLINGSTNQVSVIGKSAGNVWQSLSSPTLSKPWVVNTALPAVRLNEILARNDSAAPHNGTFPDTIELFNEGAGSVDLSGMRLTDDAADPNKFTFPAGTTLEAGTYLIVYANNNDGTPGFHLGFSLGQNGGSIHLFHRISSGGGLLDSAQFGLQLPDLSIGRLGSSGEWMLTQPTFGSANTVQPLGNASGLKINEFFATSEPPSSEDYVELYNTANLPVSVGGLYLSDTPLGRPAQHRIAEASFLGANGYFAFIADGQDDAGAEHLSFRLTSDVGVVALFDRTLGPIDYVSYGPQLPGMSTGRCPDGGVTNVLQAVLTPGAPNFCPVPPPPPPPPIMVNLLPIDATWRYLQGVNLDGTNWKDPAYNDSSWPLGQAVLGVGGAVPEPVRTPLTSSSANITYYFRSSFTVPANFNPTSLQFSNVIDDAAVFYLNGREVARYNMPGGTITNLTPPLQGLSGPPPWTGPIVISLTNVTPGLNSIAVEVHNASPFGDVFMGTRLDGVIVTNIVTAGALSINEVMADNAGSLEVNGRTPDWIELYNPTGSSIDLGGMGLNDSANNNPPRWLFPAGSIIPAGGYFVVYADGDIPASSTNTGFGFKANGGSVYLFNRAPKTNEILDRIDYGLQTPDLAIGRVPSGSTNWTLAAPTPGLANVAVVLGDPALLRINEWMADPTSGDDWFELFNGDSRPVSLGNLRLTDTFGDPNAYRIPPLSYIGVASNGFVRFEADDPATPSGPEHVNFKLSRDHDSIYLSSPSGAQLDAISFDQQFAGVSQGRLPDGAPSPFVFFPQTPSPKDSNFLPLPNVVVNEILSHSDLPLEDAVELRNVTGQEVDIGGWWLSDAHDTPRKYRIAAGTKIPPFGFAVFYEYQFNNDSLGPPFSFSSANGDQVFLSAGTANGTLTGYRAFARFGPSANGVSFGRYVNSLGAVDYPALGNLTFGTPVTAQSPPDQITTFRTGQGAANPYPKVGPIIISEIMYHPPDVIVPGVSTNDNVVEEFIELRNISASPVVLYDPVHPTNGWRLRDAVDFQFGQSHSIPPGGNLIVVSFDPATDASALTQFRSRYGSNSVLAGPYSGKLDNSTESVELVRPDAPETSGNDAGKVPYLLVEKVVYQDLPPWPTAADGQGLSLQRISATGYANDPTNWVAAAAAPGSYGVTDSDGDGMSDAFESAYAAFGLSSSNPNDGGLDPDGDGLTNLEEYLAGTHPGQGSSTLRLTAVRNGSVVNLSFAAIAGRTYGIYYTDGLSLNSSWFKLTDVTPQGANQIVIVPDYSANNSQRFYKIVTPAP